MSENWLMQNCLILICFGAESEKSVSGQVTVFSAIIMVAVLILAGLLVDAARISVDAES